MNKPAIQVTDLGKQYYTGESVRYLAFRDIIANALRWHKAPVESKQQSFWALKDITFDVEQGEVLGVIGHNGAGKSTLLKLLTRIMAPTEGRAIIQGRVGSLLEVGTGFHPELTGRENIYLNGTILGLKRSEIVRRFDEIVAFASVEQFIDTPVKRYSSGMQMRLAFAVAAHLEPEILLIDEVLTVGDAAFRKKSLGKMSEVATQGRTILFVSHNMAAVANLCKRSILLHQGRLVAIGETQAIIQQYLNSIEEVVSQSLHQRPDRKGDGKIQLTGMTLLNAEGNPVPALQSGKAATLAFNYQTPQPLKNAEVRISVHLDGIWGQRLCTLDTEYVDASIKDFAISGVLSCTIPELSLAAGIYDYSFFITVNGVIADWLRSAGKIRIEAGDYYGSGRSPEPSQGPFLMHHQWNLSADSFLKND